MSWRSFVVYGLTILPLLTAPRVCHAQGYVITVAGGANAPFGENVLATNSGLGGPNGLAVDSAGNLYIADQGSRIRKVDTAGIIRTVAGNGTLGFSGDGGPATSAALLGSSTAQGVAVDGAGNIYFADVLNHRIRKVDTNGIITTVAGTGAVIGASALFHPQGVAVDRAGNLYIGDTSNSRVRKLDTAGNLSNVAGTGPGTDGFSGDGGPAASARISLPCNLVVDQAGNLYFSDFGNNRVRKVDTAGIITTVAGNGSVFFGGDGGPATSASLSGPLGLAVDNAGNLYIADSNHDRIRKVDPAGVITTVAGNGAFVEGFADGRLATNTRLFQPRDVALDAAGTLYFADFGFNRIRKISATPPSVSVTGGLTSLSFVTTLGALNLLRQNVTISSSAAPLSVTASVSTSSGGPWLTAAPVSGRTPINLGVTANAAGLAVGAYDGTVTLTPSAPQDLPFTIAVTLTVNPATPSATAPSLAEGGVVNGASFAAHPNPVAAGSIVALFGSRLATSTVSATAVPLSTTLAGTQVLMNGRAAPLFFVSPGQINAQVPWELRGNNLINVRVVSGGVSSNTVSTLFLAGSPGIFTVAGSAAAIATHGGDGTLVTAANPAARGEVLVLYCTGLGPVTNTPASGGAGPSGPLATLTIASNVTIGGQFATIFFSGLSPGFVGLFQVNLQVPANAPVGDSVPLQLIAGARSNNVTLAIR